MREIKFRAWDKLGKKMLFSKVFHELGSSVESFLAFEYPYKHPKHKYMGWNELDLKIMQYTGLQDKNGKGIYEGDIIEYDPEEDGLGEEPFVYKDVVIWKDGGFKEKDTDEWLFIDNGNFDDVTVIGNIYENPELAKKLEERV